MTTRRQGRRLLLGKARCLQLLGDQREAFGGIDR